jgi:two-component system response regulator AlgR
MKILIADDEAPARSRLRRMLADINGCEVIAEAGHGREVLQLCEEFSPDVVLLDIRMPEMDGIETAHHLATMETAPAVIFTTAFDQFAVEAFEAQAVGYLLKPVRQARLARALDRASNISQPQINELAKGRGQSSARSNICIRKSSGLQFIPVEEILFLQADRKYVTVVHLNGEDIVEESLKALEEEFSDQFIRIHRSTMIAAAFVDRMKKDSTGQYEVWLRNCPNPLPVSRRHVTAVKNRLKNPA